jgi:hypothetical protein
MDSPAGEKGGDREEEMEIQDIYSLHSIDSEHRFLFGSALVGFPSILPLLPLRNKEP